MAKNLGEEIALNIKNLVQQISSLEPNSDQFKLLEKQALGQLKKSQVLYFCSRKEIDQAVESMSDKFVFHGFSPQADTLKMACNKYLALDQSASKLNVVKFLLCMSQSPIVNFLKNPEEYIPEVTEEQIDWKRYLNEGFEDWHLDYEQNSSDESDLSFVEESKEEVKETSSNYIPLVSSESAKCMVNFEATREELLNTIQHSWFNQKTVFQKPESEWREANVGILWDEFLSHQVKDLIPLPKVNVITEYQAVREIIWQLFNVHTSTIFHLSKDDLVPTPNITISSVRAETFEKFLRLEFLPHIKLLESFRLFEQKVFDLSNSYPNTYRSYANGLRKIIQPVYIQLSNLEDTVRKQEQTMTFLILSKELNEILEPIKVLKEIHDYVTAGSETDSLRLALDLLERLHEKLMHTTCKLEQDLCVFLYLETLYHYLRILDCWFVKDDFYDYSKDFPVINENFEQKNALPSNPTMNIYLKKGFEVEDTVLRIFSDQILKIGRNLHFLRVLGKPQIFQQNQESIHKELVQKTLKNLQKFFNQEENQSTTFQNPAEEKEIQTMFKFPVVESENCKKPTEMDRLENLVDTSDGFLMLAFKDYLTCNISNSSEPNSSILYKKIKEITKGLVPFQGFFEEILNEILMDRFTISGLMVKRIMIEEFKLVKQFEFLRHVYLFFDDVIFQFHRRLFERIGTAGKYCGGEVWLTSNFQEAIFDIHPEFSEQCFIIRKEDLLHFKEPPELLTSIVLKYPLKWPMNIIISKEQMDQYEEMFGFILQLKWALYTLNHLNFNELEDLRSVKLVKQLHQLRFIYINLFNTIQHYIFGFVFYKNLFDFELEFERSSDLNSMIEAHAGFVKKTCFMAKEVFKAELGCVCFGKVLVGVKKLEMVWRNAEKADGRVLKSIKKVHDSFYDVINCIVNPVNIFDYFDG